VIIKLTIPPPSARSASLPPGGGQVLHVAFRALDKLEARINELYALPEIEESDRVGDRTIFTDGEVVCLLEVEIGPDGERLWVRREEYDHEMLVRHLNARRSHRRRLERRVQRLRCDHCFNSARCIKCNEPKPVKYRLCRAVPSHWTWRTKDGRSSRFKRTPRCRRRLGHDGDCSWVGDPGCTKGPNWCQPAG
jgi:hypothetical protein